MEVDHQKILPLIRTRIISKPINCKNLTELYSRFDKNLGKIVSEESFNCLNYENNFLNVFKFLLLKPLSESNIKLLRYLVDPIEIINSCRILTYGKSIKYPKPGSGIHISDHRIHNDIFLTKIIKLKSTQLNSVGLN